MADDFRRGLDRRSGIGGVKCHCCNDYKGKDRKCLRRIVRRGLKQKIRRLINNAI